MRHRVIPNKNTVQGADEIELQQIPRRSGTNGQENEGGEDYQESNFCTFDGDEEEGDRHYEVFYDNIYSEIELQ